MIYYILFFIIAFFSVLGEDYRITKNRQILFASTLIILIALFAGLRDAVWTDWDLYKGFYTHPQHYDNDFEWGYVWWNRLLKKLTFSYNAYLCVSYTLLLSLYYYCCYRINQQHTLFSFLILYSVYLLPSSGFRQYIAMNIFLYSLIYAAQRDLKKYLLLIGIAFLFHRTILFVIPTYWLFAKNISLKYFCILILLGISLSSLNIFDNIIDYILERFAGTNALMLNSFKNRIALYSANMEQENLLNIGLLRKIAFSLCFIHIYKNIRDTKMYSKDEISRYSFFINIYITGVFLSTFIYGIFSRVECYFYIVECFIIPLSIIYIRSKRKRIIFMVSLIIILGVMFFWKLKTFYPESFIPYRNILTDW